jgi:hypothetical protein
VRKALIALLALSAVWALAVVMTGGIDLRPHGIPFKSTGADRPSLLLLVLALVYVAVYRDHARAHLRHLEHHARAWRAVADRRAGAVAVILSLIVCGAGVVYGVHVAGGSDSYGYISQADLWLAGDLVTEQPMVRQVPWPDAPQTLTPMGYRPTADGTATVPTYSYGLPLMMAAAKLVAGMCGLYLVTPLLGALTVGMTYLLGARVWSRGVGLAAAALMATSPAFLFMQMNPMSDVPVSGLFTAALVLSLSGVRSAAFWTGLVVSLAILVRPNLVPLGIVFVAWFAARADGWRSRLREVISFGIGGLPLIAGIAITNTVLHGAPWSSGYGPIDAYYAWGYLLSNVKHYGASLIETETPFVLLAVVPVVMLRRFEGDQRARVAFILLFAVALWLCYAFYTPYEAWWYLRFYLPAFPPLLVLAVIGCRQLLRGMAGGTRVVMMAAILVVVLALRVQWVQASPIFRLWESGVEFTSPAEYVRTRLPSNAVILTVNHSGSVRYYANRMTIRWDWIGQEWWPRALHVLRDMGYRPYLLTSRFEEPSLRRHFKFGDHEDAPGIVVAEMPSPFNVVLYDPLREHGSPREAMPVVVSCPCAIR